MWTARYKLKLGVIGALAAALLASGCSGGSPVGAQSTADTLTCHVAGEEENAAAKVDNVAVTCPEKFYSLGGTISGLTRTGLVLANGANMGSVAANSTSFTLQTPMAYNASYAVTVASQPAGLTCSVSNGSGVMPASNVTSLKVKCVKSSDAVVPTDRDLRATRLALLLGLARNARSSRY